MDGGWWWHLWLVGESVLVVLLIFMAVTSFTRSHLVANIVASHSAGSPMRRMAVRLLGASDACISNTLDGRRNLFRVGTPTGNGCLLGVSDMNCGAAMGHVRVSSSGGLTVNGIILNTSTVVLGNTIIATVTRGIGLGRSAFICGSTTCHAPRNSMIRRLIGHLPNTRIDSSNAVGVGNGRIGGVLISNGRFVANSAGATLGGLPADVVSGVGTCSRGDSLSGMANVSSNRRRAILSFNIGGNVGGNLVSGVSLNINGGDHCGVHNVNNCFGSGGQFVVFTGTGGADSHKFNNNPNEKF